MVSKAKYNLRRLQFMSTLENIGTYSSQLLLTFRAVMLGICGCDRFSSCSIGDVLQSIVKKDGYVGLMRGWVQRMLFHAPAAAIYCSTDEAAKSFFQELNIKQACLIDR